MDQRAASRGGSHHRGHRRAAQLRGAAGVLSAMAVLVGVVMMAAGCVHEAGTSTTASVHGSTTGSSSTAATTAAPTTQPTDAGTSTTTAGPPVIKIGALFPLTGDLAAEGESALKGMRLAVEEVNAAGGIAALDGARLTVVEADSKGDATTADALVAHLVQSDGVAAIVGAGQSTVALQATDAAERLQIPFMVSSGAAEEITQRNLDYTFRLCPEADWYARDQVAFLKALSGLAGLDITSVALLHENGEFGKQTAASQKAYLARAGIQVVADIEYSPEKAELNNEFLAIRQSGAQAILTATLLSDATVIAEDASVLHMNLPIIDAAGGVLDPGFIQDAGVASENIMSVGEVAPGIAPTRDLEQKLSASGTQLDPDLLYGYQAVWVLASALERGASAKGPELRGALKTTALYGDHLVLPQSLLMFDGAGQNREARLLVMQVQGGKMVTVWPVEYAQGTVRLP